MKKSLKKILIVALIATSGVAAAGGQVEAAAKPAPKPVPKVAPSPNPAEPALMRASGIRW